MMGGLGGMPGMPQNEEEYQAAMEQMLDSPMMKEFLSDPEKIEQSRLALLNNPMAARRAVAKRRGAFLLRAAWSARVLLNIAATFWRISPRGRVPRRPCR